MPLRCAFGCKNTYPDIVLHVMPNPDKFPERFKAWVSLLGGKLETSTDYEKYKKKRICDLHFSQEYRNRYNRLNALAVPTLHLPGTLHRFPKPEFPHLEKFNAWKRILDRGLQEKNNTYIYNQVRLCSKHFEHYYISSSHRLTSNAVPTLYLNADAVTASAPSEFSWQRPPEVIPCVDEVALQIDDSLNAPDSAGGDSDDDIDSQHDRLHSDYKCNECGTEIVGYRYTCVQCCDFDLCGACEASGAHPEHYVLRLPRPEPAAAVKGLLETLRGLLDQGPLLHLPQDQLKTEEIDEEDPLSFVFVPPEPASFDDIEAEEHEEEESKEDIPPPVGDKLPRPYLKAVRTNSISNIPTDTPRIQPLDKARLDIGNCTSNKVLLRLRNLSEVMPIVNDDSFVERSVVRPYEERTEMSDVGHGMRMPISGTSVARLGADARVSGESARALVLPEKLDSLDDQILHEAKRIKRV